MQKAINGNIFSIKLTQTFNFLQYEISDNYPVRKLSSILEGLDFYFLCKIREVAQIRL